MSRYVSVLIKLALILYYQVQIIGDDHGNIYHCFERECSVQRRHQKVIEETPAVILDDDLRQKMTSVAVTIGKSIDYIGAGTVEFILVSIIHLSLEYNVILIRMLKPENFTFWRLIRDFKSNTQSLKP